MKDMRKMKYAIRNKRILIVNPFGIGDVLFATPLIDAIKADNPYNYIGFLCNIRTAPIFLADKRINKVFIFEKDEYRELWKISKIRCIKRLFSIKNDIKIEAFDTVLDISLSREYGFFLMLAGIRERVGFNYKNRGTFLTKKIPLPFGYYNKPIADYYLDLLKPTGILSKESLPLKMDITDSAREKAALILTKNGILENESFISIAPGGGASWGDNFYRRLWPKESFLKVAKELTYSTDLKLVLLGSGADKKICDYIKSELPNVINLCSKTDLMSFAAIIKKANLLITNDGGPLHIGVAVGTKTVSIFGPVDDKVYGPYTKDGHIAIKNNDIECAPCYKGFKLPECNDIKCLNSITPDTVIDAARELLKL